MFFKDQSHPKKEHFHYNSWKSFLLSRVETLSARHDSYCPMRDSCHVLNCRTAVHDASCDSPFQLNIYCLGKRISNREKWALQFVNYLAT